MVWPLCTYSLPILKRFSLWHHSDFLRLWASQTVSQFGTQITFLALPLIAINFLRASAFEISILNAVAWLPTLLVGLVAGVWVDKLKRRPILISSDLLRGAILLWIPIAFALGILSIWQLYFVAFAVGLCTVFFDVAYGAYLPSLVEREQLVEGNTGLEFTNSAARVGGPAIAGGLIALLSAPFAIVLDALSYAGSSFFVMFIKKREHSPEPDNVDSKKSNMLRDVNEGLRYVLTHPLLRPTAIFGLFANFSLSMVEAVFLVYVVRTLGLEAGAIGIIFATGNVGLLVAIAFASTASKGLGIGGSILLGGALYSFGIFLVPLAPAFPLPILIAAQAIRSFGIVVYNINQVSLRQTVTPAHTLGRTNATMRFLGMGAIPLGSLFGGSLATLVNLPTTLWVAAVLSLMAILPIALSPIAKLYKMPQAEEGV